MYLQDHQCLVQFVLNNYNIFCGKAPLGHMSKEITDSDLLFPDNDFTFVHLCLLLAVAVGAVERRALVGEAEGAHTGLREASTALPGGADGEADAAVAQPAAVTLVVLMETPGSVELADQCQPASVAFADVRRLLETE